MRLAARDLGPELRAQPPCFADGAAHAALGALGAARGPAEREEALRRPLLLCVGQPLAVHVIGELSELMHGDHLFLSLMGLSCAPLSPVARAVTIRSDAQERHRIRLVRKSASAG
jgi:hypothetical protein